MGGTIETKDGKIVAVRYIIELDTESSKFFITLTNGHRYEVLEDVYKQLKTHLDRVG